MRVAKIIGQQVIIDNRTGGNAVVATNAVVRAPRDGQTFLIDAANQITNPLLMKDLPFDYEQTWLPVTQLASFPQVVAVKQDFPSKTIQEFIEAAKAKPGTISYCTPPAAAMAHMAGEELQRRAGIKLIHVPYRGGADAARDIGASAVDSSPPAVRACWRSPASSDPPRSRTCPLKKASRRNKRNKRNNWRREGGPRAGGIHIPRGRRPAGCAQPGITRL